MITLAKTKLTIEHATMHDGIAGKRYEEVEYVAMLDTKKLEKMARKAARSKRGRSVHGAVTVKIISRLEATHHGA